MDEVLGIAKRMNVKPLLVTLVNGAFFPFVCSWLCNTNHMGIHSQVLILTTDMETRNKIQNLWSDVKVVAVSGKSFKGEQEYSHAGYIRLLNFRSHIVLKLLLDNVELLLFEVDAVWFHNPIPLLSKEKGYDILVSHVSSRPNLVAGGFIYMFPTIRTKELWKMLDDRLSSLDNKISSMPSNKTISEEQNDQVYLSGLVRKRLRGIRPKYLSLELFADGKWYNLPEIKRNNSQPIIVNNNWLIGTSIKISNAKKWGHWFVDEDNFCNGNTGKI
ncbi:unnamed protein product [Mytilus edulis]|uniref:Nucleotide-diphospho-sugar transferase domain-containing protein n=1 Tax=Mytilus edulis TaxID=6550 RepID=A0A8S3RB53_MYTED|nr:unnamed protein product [Mytilus edulis]